MREILFRGLHRRKGEKVKLNGMPVESMWVYGGYCQYNAERGIIYQKEPFNKFSVYADSVGQYTGLTDKNGKMIFEGDIIKGKEKATYAIGYSDATAGFYAKATLPQKILPCMNIGTMKHYEVIGNIHDNPELLETN